MIITLKGADFSTSNIGTLSTWIISRILGDGATYNGVTYVDKDAALNATVTIAEGYELGPAGVTVTMGGVALDSGVIINENIITITIDSVTGNVDIKVPTVNASTGEEGGNEEGGTEEGGNGEGGNGEGGNEEGGNGEGGNEEGGNEEGGNGEGGNEEGGNEEGGNGDDTTEPTNLIALGTAHANTKLGASNSTPTSGEGYTVYSDIPVTGNSVYTFTNCYRSWWLKSNKQDISNFNPGTSIIISPSTAAYLSVTTSDAKEASIVLIYDGSSGEKPEGENIITQGTLHEGKSLDSASYAMTSNAAYYVYDKIPVESGAIYKLNVGSARAWWLDASKTKISTINLISTNYFASVPENAAYLSVAINLATTAVTDAYMIKVI